MHESRKLIQAGTARLMRLSVGLNHYYCKSIWKNVIVVFLEEKRVLEKCGSKVSEKV